MRQDRNGEAGRVNPGKHADSPFLSTLSTALEEDWKVPVATLVQPTPPPPAAPLRWLGRALRLRVLHKLWLANAVLVFVVAMAAGTLAARADGRLSLWAGAAVAAAAGALIHLHLLRLALQPVTLLVRTAEQVAGGAEESRAPTSVFADPELERLVAVFNQSLDAVATDRRRLRDLATRAQDEQEAERLRIARTLHEGTVQTLTALLLGLRLVRRTPDRLEREVMLDSMRDDLVAATEAVRRAAFELRPAALDELGVGAAVERAAREACVGAGIELACELEPAGDALSHEAAITLYRLVQEAVENVIRHGHARRMWIQMLRQAGFVETTVRDDGRGFDVAETLAHGRCLGLFAMEQRAARVNGSVRVESSPGRGTRVVIRIPAPTGEAAA